MLSRERKLRGRWQFLAIFFVVGTIATCLFLPHYTYAAITRVQIVNPASTACSGTTCTITVSSTTAGDLGVITFIGSSVVTSISSVSGGGTWVANGACLSSDLELVAQISPTTLTCLEELLRSP